MRKVINLFLKDIAAIGICALVFTTVYYGDGWNYLYRSYHLLRKFKFEQKSDGIHHLTEMFESDKKSDIDLLEEVLLSGYFEKPFCYKRRIQTKNN